MFYQQTTSVIGLPMSKGWSQVIELELDAQSSYHFVLAIAGDQAKSVGREVETLIAEYQPATAEQLHQCLIRLQSAARDNGVRMLVAVLLVRGHDVVFAAQNGAIGLSREDKIGQLIKADEELQLRVGKFNPDDIVILMTAEAAVYWETIEQQLQKGLSLDSIAGSLSHLVHAQADSSLVTVLMMTGKKPNHQRKLGFTLGLKWRKDKQLSSDELDHQAEIDIDDQTNESQTGGELVESDYSEPSLSTNSANRKRSLLSTVGGGVAVLIASLGRNLQGFGSIFSQSLKNRRQGAGSTVVSVEDLNDTFSQHSIEDLAPIATSPSITRHKKPFRIPKIPNTKTRLKQAVIFLVVLLIAGFLIWQFVARKQAQADVNTQLAPFSEQVAQVAVLVETDPIAARAQLQSATVELEALQASYEAGSYGAKRSSQELATAQQLYDQISGREELAELPIFLNLQDFSPSLIASNASLNQQKIWLIDSDSRALLVVDSQKQQPTTSQVSGTAPIIDLANVGQQAYILGQGVNFLASADAEAETVIAEGDSNRDAKLIANFNDYLYLFNPEKRNIYRYLKSGSGFSDPVGWLVEPLGVSFTDVVSWVVDGDIWLGTTQGEIKKFRSGRAEEFTVVGLEKPFSSSIYLATQPDYEQIYLLEPSENRVVTLAKDGRFIREVTNFVLGSATDLLYDEVNDLLLAVSGSIVYLVPTQ